MSQLYYQDAADKMIQLINRVFVSEETMLDFVKEEMRLSSLDRTKTANLLVKKLFDKSFPTPPTDIDKRMAIIGMLEKEYDFNLISQMALNIPSALPVFDLVKLNSEATKVQEHHKNSSTDNPTTKKAKFKAPEEPNCKEWNRELAILKNASILSEYSPLHNSSRISPINSTPALADFQNLSSLSLYGLDEFLVEGEIYLVNCDKILVDFNYRVDDDGSIRMDGLTFPIMSKSGGDIVRKALAVRKIVSMLYNDIGVMSVVPRYDSVLIRVVNSNTQHILTSLLESEYLIKYGTLAE